MWHLLSTALSRYLWYTARPAPFEMKLAVDGSLPILTLSTFLIATKLLRIGVHLVSMLR